MELTERITGRVTELTGEAGRLRKQLADAEHELELLVIAGQVIAQLAAGDAPVAGEAAGGSAGSGSRPVKPRSARARGPVRACAVLRGAGRG